MKRSTTGGNSTLHPVSSSSLSRPMDYQLPCRCSYTIGARYTHYGTVQCSKRMMRGYGRYLSGFTNYLSSFFFHLTFAPSLLQKMAHDLRTTISPVYPDLLDRLLSLLPRSISAPALTALLETFSSLFRYLLIPGIDPKLLDQTWSQICAVLPKCLGEIQRALAEVWGGVLRRMKAGPREKAANLLAENAGNIEDATAWVIVFACKVIFFLSFFTFCINKNSSTIIVGISNVAHVFAFGIGAPDFLPPISAGSKGYLHAPSKEFNSPHPSCQKCRANFHDRRSLCRAPFLCSQRC